MAFAVVGCELQPQERFTFNPQTPEQFTFGETTPWEWLQTNPKEEFTYMIEAIKLAGLQDEYSNKTDKRTYFLIKDLGFTKFNGIFRREYDYLNDGALTPLQNLNTAVDTPEKITKLRNILMYHILPKYVDQGPDNLFTLDFNYEFPTLSPDPNNKIMTINRDWNYTMRINEDPNLGTGSKINTDTKLHNYIFSNGNSVAHLTEGYARVEPFEPVE
tara:strand:+ start:4699 stop:5346 length:648 start_codon:yes stop_codon:yes gene_type:complete